jgi:nuclear pore complex protein Nup62
VANEDERIKNKTVGEILDLWNKDLEDHLISFNEQAREVKSWDDKLKDNTTKILKLQKGVQNVGKQQFSLDHQLNVIENQQKEFSESIAHIEAHFKQAATAGRAPDSDEKTREQAYALAAKIDEELNEMKNSLTATVTKLNQSVQARMTDANPLTKIVQILNYQTQSLAWIEAKSAELENQLRVAHQLLQQTHQGLPASPGSY